MNTVSVSSVAARNYKNIRLEEGIALRALNVFVGPNGSGKSNLIRLLQFLQDSVSGTGSDDQRGRSAFEDAVFRLGGDKILDGNLNAPANVAMEYRFPTGDDETVLKIELLVQAARRQVIVDQEFLGSYQGRPDPFTFYHAHNEESGGSGQGVVSVYSEPQTSPHGSKRRSTHFEKIRDMPVNELALSAMPRLLESSRNAPEDTPLYGARGRVIGSTASWKFYNANDMNLKEIRLSEPRLGPSDIYLSPTGENLPLVFHNLVQLDYAFDETLNQMMSAILPRTRKIRVAAPGRLSLTLEWYVEGNQEPYFLSEMSDGTVRMLCWAVILHSPWPPALIAIDEPELGIHPAWLPTLAEWIKRAARRTQVIVTTHSPDLLDHFTDQLDDGGFVYVFQPDAESVGHFRPKRTVRTAVNAWLEEGWQLGDLYRVGNPAIGGWPW